jgi:hypothetical protein
MFSIELSANSIDILFILYLRHKQNIERKHHMVIYIYYTYSCRIFKYYFMTFRQKSYA